MRQGRTWDLPVHADADTISRQRMKAQQLETAAAGIASREWDTYEAACEHEGRQT